MSDRDAFRAEQQERRRAGKAKQHEKRLENATYTAAEVKVLTETASKFAYELGRKEAGEEIAEALKAYFPDPHHEGEQCDNCDLLRDLAGLVINLSLLGPLHTKADHRDLTKGNT